MKLPKDTPKNKMDKIMVEIKIIFSAPRLVEYNCPEPPKAAPKPDSFCWSNTQTINSPTMQNWLIFRTNCMSKKKLP